MMGPTTRRRAVAGLSAAGILAGFGGARHAAASAQLVVTTYGGRYEKFWREQLVPPFQEKTGTQVVLDIGLGANYAANLRATGPEKPVYSYIMANELVGAVLRAEGFFEAWPAAKVPNLQTVHPKANPSGQGVTVMFSPIGIAYRSDLVKTPPRSWKDLWDNPEIKGKVGLYQIDNTAAYMFLMMISRVYGSGAMDFDAGFRQIERLKPFPQVALAGALAVLLSRGEIVAGPLDFGETLALKKKGVPVSWAAPAEGLFMFDQTFSLLKHGPNKDAACAFLDYMLSGDVQRKLAVEFSGVPVNRDVKLSQANADEQPLGVNDLDRIVSFDWVAANAEREAVTERWNRITR
jgi:putative spermidine/putrescine transport system substrate-binding protein